jgi:hypothetical protein
MEKDSSEMASLFSLPQEIVCFWLCCL